MGRLEGISGRLHLKMHQSRLQQGLRNASTWSGKTEEMIPTAFVKCASDLYSGIEVQKREHTLAALR